MDIVLKERKLGTFMVLSYIKKNKTRIVKGIGSKNTEFSEVRRSASNIVYVYEFI